MTPVELSRTVLRAVRSAVDAGELAVGGTGIPGRITVEPPRPGGHGDYATNVALQLARPAGRPASQVAEVIRRRLLDEPGIDRVDITGPGFLNLTLDPEEHGDAALVARVLDEGPRYGHAPDAFTASDVPTVPDVPTTTGAFTASEAPAPPDAPVERHAAIGRSPLPDPDASAGRHGLPAGRDGASAPPDVVLLVSDELRARVIARAVVRLLATQGVRAVPRDERSAPPDPHRAARPTDPAAPTGPFPPVAPDASTGPLRPSAPVPSTAPGEPTGQGAPTAPGAPTTAGAPTSPTASGVPTTSDAPTAPVRTVLPRPVPVRGVSGEPAAEDAPARAALRWALLHPAPHDPPGDPVVHLPRREGNPLFRVQYAHARTHALRRNARDLGFSARPGECVPRTTPHGAPYGTHHDARRDTPPGTRHGTHRSPDTAGHPDDPALDDPALDDPALDGPAPDGPVVLDRPVVLDGPAAPGGQVPVAPDATAARDLARLLAEYPRVLASAARDHAPDRLARHLVDLADGFLRFQAGCPVLPVGDEKPSAAHRARLALAEAAGTVLAGGLTLLGIDAPEHL
ncbi:DALR anticodon-binding domain-containing protein [Streptomyces sp. JNUCC 64]